MFVKGVPPGDAERIAKLMKREERARKREENRAKREGRAARRAEREEKLAKLDRFCRREFGMSLADVTASQRQRWSKPAPRDAAPGAEKEG